MMKCKQLKKHAHPSIRIWMHTCMSIWHGKVLIGITIIFFASMYDTYIYIYYILYIYSFKNANTHMYIHIYIYMCVCVELCWHAHTYTHICIYIYESHNILQFKQRASVEGVCLKKRDAYVPKESKRSHLVLGSAGLKKSQYRNTTAHLLWARPQGILASCSRHSNPIIPIIT